MSNSQPEAGFTGSADVGYLPSGWSSGHLEDYWGVHDCKHVTATFVSTGFPVVSIGEVQSRFVDLRRAPKTTPEFYALLTQGNRKPDPGNLIMSRNATVGQVAQVAKWHPAFAMGQDVCLLRPRSKLYSTDYLQFLLKSSSMEKRFSSLMAGSTFKRINVQQIKRLDVSLPPPSEQVLIAKMLVDAEELVTCIERLIDKKLAVKRGMMQQLLAGKVRLPGFVDPWAKGTLGEVAVILDNLRIPLSSVQRRERIGPYPYCGANGVVDHIDDYMIDDDVVLLAEDGGYFDQFQTRPIAYRMKGKIWVNNHAHVLKGSPRVDTGYMLYALQHKDITSFISSGTRSKLTRAELVRITVKLPSVNEQRAISSVLVDADNELDILRVRLDKAKAIKQGMMQELLTGRTRLPIKEAIA